MDRSLLIDHVPARDDDRAWTAESVRRLEADGRRSADTHLVRLDLPGPVDLYLKDESTHPTGSLKHRLARSLFLYALCNGWIGPRTTVVEASSGSTAVSEAYFARLIGVPFVAVMAASTSAAKIELIEREGGRCELIEDATAVSQVAAALAERLGGHFLDQFTYAERATDWRGNNNIAESTLSQLAYEEHPEPAWIVVGAGTGGTAATFGRYLRLRGISSRLCVVDPEGSAFLPHFCGEEVPTHPSRIEGIGRAGVEPSFLPGVIDRMMGVPDGASVATMRFLSDRFGLSTGPSTGTSVFGALRLACEMRAQGRAGSIVSLLCDSGNRYQATYADDAWLAGSGIDPAPFAETVARAWDDGVWASSPSAPRRAPFAVHSPDVAIASSTGFRAGVPSTGASLGRSSHVQSQPVARPVAERAVHRHRRAGTRRHARSVAHLPAAGAVPGRPGASSPAGRPAHRGARLVAIAARPRARWGERLRVARPALAAEARSAAALGGGDQCPPELGLRASGLAMRSPGTKVGWGNGGCFRHRSRGRARRTTPGSVSSTWWSWPMPFSPLSTRPAPNCSRRRSLHRPAPNVGPWPSRHCG